MKGIPVRLALRIRREQPFRQAQGDPRFRPRVLACLLQRAREVWQKVSHRLQSPQRLLSPKWSDRVASGARMLRYLFRIIEVINQINDFRHSVCEMVELLNQALQWLL
jgi:hypothetical protein